jgi:PleD family two-component response regulator
VSSTDKRTSKGREEREVILILFDWLSAQTSIKRLLMQSLTRPPIAKPITILCVEDDKDCCELLDFILSGEGFEVVSCSTSKEGLHLAKQGGFSAIILDYCLPEISGIEICREIRTFDKQTPIYILYRFGVSQRKGSRISGRGKRLSR